MNIEDFIGGRLEKVESGEIKPPEVGRAQHTVDPAKWTLLTNIYLMALRRYNAKDEAGNATCKTPLQVVVRDAYKLYGVEFPEDVKVVRMYDLIKRDSADFPNLLKEKFRYGY